MTFIDTIPPERATGVVAELYDTDRENFGHVANFTQAFSLQPEVFAAWKRLSGSVKASLDLRHYELATIAAANRLRSSYCMLAHGSVLLDKFMEPDALQAVVTDRRAAGLDALDVAIMDLSEKVVDDATSITQADIDGLRSLGLPDAEILGVVLAAAVRCFFSKVLDGVGAQPDHKYAGLEPALRETLTVGRPIAAA